MNSIKTEITIDAPAGDVWSHLMNFELYPKWNSFIPSIIGKPIVGTKLTVTLQPPGGKKMTIVPKCVAIEPGVRFEWKGSIIIPGLFDGRHSFLLIPQSPNKTLFIHSEKFSGILVPIIWKSIHKMTLAGFELMNQQLKERVERNQTSGT